jgi:hypothetical protein
LQCPNNTQRGLSCFACSTVQPVTCALPAPFMTGRPTVQEVQLNANYEVHFLFCSPTNGWLLLFLTGPCFGSLCACTARTQKRAAGSVQHCRSLDKVRGLCQVMFFGVWRIASLHALLSLNIEQGHSSNNFKLDPSVLGSANESAETPRLSPTFSCERLLA